MRPALEGFARRWWGGQLGAAGSALAGLAAPLSWAYDALARRRARRSAGRGARLEGATVVSVGNLAVGGTGKTPTAAWVAARLTGHGVPTALVTGTHSADEAELHRRWQPGVTILVGRDRAGVAASARDEGVRAVVLDDGFQHFALARDLDVVLLSAEDPFPGRVLPSGPYREAPEALSRADAVVVSWRAAGEARAREVAAAAAEYAPEATSAGAELVASGIEPLACWVGGGSMGEGTATDGSADTPGGALLAVCGVARPESFRSTLAAACGRDADDVDLLAFRDHHAYGAADVERILDRTAGRAVVVTEKDAVKLERFAGRLGSAWVLSERLRWAWGEQALARRIDALLAERVER